MKKSGQIVLFRFLQTDQTQGNLRPALLIGQLPGEYDDWLICMISSQLRHYIKGFDEIIDNNSPDFSRSGLKKASLIRIGRLAVADKNILIGTIGEISLERLRNIKEKLAGWLLKITLCATFYPRYEALPRNT